MYKLTSLTSLTLTRDSEFRGKEKNQIYEMLNILCRGEI